MERIIEPDSTQLEFSRHFPFLVLASSSPNRRALVEAGGSKVTLYKPRGEEKSDREDCFERIMELSENKMREYLSSTEPDKGLPAISADTMVLFNGNLIGKPKDRSDARETLKMLSGNKHSVISGSTLYIPGNDPVTIFDVAEVYFKRLSDREIEEYLDTKDYIGAAGSYRLQRNGWSIVQRIDGNWSTVVGLPLRSLISLEESLRSAQSQA